MKSSQLKRVRTLWSYKAAVRLWAEAGDHVGCIADQDRVVLVDQYESKQVVICKLSHRRYDIYQGISGLICDWLPDEQRLLGCLSFHTPGGKFVRYNFGNSREFLTNVNHHPYASGDRFGGPFTFRQ